jgi:hypothetical protein
MSQFYEDTLLREEYKLVVKLQQDAEFVKYVTVKYEDRITGIAKSVLNLPTANKYPEKYIVNYKMPVYVSEGNVRNDYNATATITLSEAVLNNRNAANGPHVEFSSNFDPFNNHVKQTWICTGNAWSVAKDNGLWHFIISLGALINQDEFVCAEGVHIDKDAYNYWVERRRRPVTPIKWPVDLLTRKEIKVVSKPTTDVKPKITIVKKNQEQSPAKKITIIKK